VQLHHDASVLDGLTIFELLGEIVDLLRDLLHLFGNHAWGAPRSASRILAHTALQLSPGATVRQAGESSSVPASMIATRLPEMVTGAARRRKPSAIVGDATVRILDGELKRRHDCSRCGFR